ncbi:MAG: polyprenyl synthetase family protein [Planctomycetes bacterium]|nr:polyprenyl synthetase family protein [Planctomycetota bacterium]
MAVDRLKQIYRSIQPELMAMSAILEREMETRSEVMAPLLGHLAAVQGKQVRPALLLLAARSCGGIRPEHHQLAVVVELIHTATLVHDDIIDGASLRRQIETPNRKFGNETAVLLGDFLFAKAFTIASRLGTPVASRLLSQICNEICTGEVTEVHYRGVLELREEQYLEIIRQKTACLFGASSELGGRYGIATEEQALALQRYGECLGMAFQIVDDCLDFVGEEDIMGKALGDNDHFKVTLPMIHFLRTAPERERERFCGVFREGKLEEKKVELRALFKEFGALPYAYASAERYAAEARASLSVLPPSPSRDAMSTIAEFVISRDH